MITDFIFDGRTLSSFGYILIFENEEDTIDVSNISFVEIKGARNDRSYRAGYKYDNNYSATYTIIKNPCDNSDDLDMSDEDISELTRWLCRKQYKWFSFIDPDNNQVWYKGYFTVQKKEIGDSLVGLAITLHTNAPYGFSGEIISTYLCNDDNNRQFQLMINSDEEGYIYPDIEIKLLEGGAFRLRNATEDRTTVLLNCKEGEIIKLYGYDLQQIESDNEDHDYIYDFNYKFPRLHNLYTINENIWECSLNCEITFKYREIRKVGLK